MQSSTYFLKTIIEKIQLTTIQGFPAPQGVTRRCIESPKIGNKYRSAQSVLAVTTPPRRLRSAGQLRESEGKNRMDEAKSASSPHLRANSSASCYQVTSLNEPSARKLCRY